MRCLKHPVWIALIVLQAVSCENQKHGADEIKLVEKYLEAGQAGSENKWNYADDTVKVWFDEKKGEPVKRIKGQQSTGKWKEWDEAMHSTSGYDTLWYDESEHAVKGYFFEDNEFYRLIGKAPTKTLQTYWLNAEDEIYEILIYWIPEENTTTSQHLKPIVEWAYANDSSAIADLYPEGRIIPSRENAERWKELLRKFRDAQNDS